MPLFLLSLYFQNTWNGIAYNEPPTTRPSIVTPLDYNKDKNNFEQGLSGKYWKKISSERKL